MVHTQRHLHCTVNDKMGKARNRKEEKKTSVQRENRKWEGQGQDKKRKKGLCLPQTKTYCDI